MNTPLAHYIVTICATCIKLKAMEVIRTYPLLGGAA